MIDRKIIYITGYPRSGNTWLGRLLADVLGCEYNSYDGERGDWPGDKTDVPYLVRKTHALETPDPEHTVFIYRDPRGVAVSLMFYRGYPDLAAAIDAMSESIEALGVIGYEDFINTWWNTGKAACEVRYLDLHKRPVETLRDLAEKVTGLALDDLVCRRAIARQSIKQAQERYQDMHHLRNGKVGDWRNYFTQSTGRMMQERFGPLMLRQGYIQSVEWWKDLPA